MKRIRQDLWETRPASPFPGLTTHAYLWVSPAAGNVVFYATAGAEDFEEIERLGGAAHQYLSHQDEAGPALRDIRDRFGTALHAPAAEVGAIAEHAPPDVVFDRWHVDGNGVEVIPTPGHSPGSTSFVVTGYDELRYLFTGDTVYLGDDGRWRAGYLPGVSDRGALAASLDVLASVEPDLVASSAYAGAAGCHLVEGARWADAIEQARESLPA